MLLPTCLDTGLRSFAAKRLPMPKRKVDIDVPSVQKKHVDRQRSDITHAAVAQQSSNKQMLSPGHSENSVGFTGRIISDEAQLSVLRSPCLRNSTSPCVQFALGRPQLSSNESHAFYATLQHVHAAAVVVCCLLFVVCCLLFVGCWLLFVVCCWWC